LTISDGVTTEDIPMTKTGVLEVMFVRFTVGGGAGDMDGNNAKDGRYVSGFVAAVIAGSGACADTNGDTAVSDDDVVPFINLLLTSAACP